MKYKKTLTMDEMRAACNRITLANGGLLGGVARIGKAIYHWDNRFNHWRLVSVR